MPGNGTIEFWKYTTSALAGVTCTGIAVWLAGAATWTSRAEVSSMIETNAPYVKDKALITEKLDNLAKASSSAAERLENITQRQAEMSTKLTVIAEKLDGRDCP